MSAPVISRAWAMPSCDTFDCPPISAFVHRYLKGVTVDPFARNKRWAQFTNDLNPETKAEYHMDAEQFLRMLSSKGVRADCVLIDPPYSPRQVKECYDAIGQTMEQGDALLGAIRKKRKTALVEIMNPGGFVLTFGWNSVGMGERCGFEIKEILLVCHGSDHNDTICVAEQMKPRLFA